MDSSFIFRKVCIFLFLCFAVGCTYTQQRLKDYPPSPDVRERTQRDTLMKSLVRWEESINSVIDSLQNEIEKNNSLRQEGLSLEEKASFLEKKEDIDSYLNIIKKIKTLQKKLQEGDNAVYRENRYVDLVDQYLESLKKAQTLREKEYAWRLNIQKLEKDIVKHYRTKNYYRVIELYDLLPKNKKGEEIPLVIKVSYALSLVGLEQEDDARKVIEVILAQGLAVTSDNAPMFFELGEWLINTRQTELAQKNFQALNAFYMNEEMWHEKVKEKSALLAITPQNIIVKNKIEQARVLFEQRKDFPGAYQLGLEAQRECTDITCQNGVQTFLNQLAEDAKSQIVKKLWEIDQKINMSKYSEAYELLSSLKRSFPGGAYPFAVQEKLALIPAKEDFLRSKQGEMAEETVKQKLERANKLFESENYEEAIVLFDELDSTLYSTEAKEKKNLAIDGLARNQRLKAGQLFLQARDIQNVELKKSYLIESYKLLKNVMEKYPNNSYAEKINKNLVDVRAEIEKIYPEFFLSEKFRRSN